MGGIVNSIFGGIDGSNAASKAADDASGSENSLIQNGILPIDNSLLNDYNNNVAPVQAQTGTAESQLGSTLSNGSLSGLLGGYMNATGSPGATDAATGINNTGTTNNALNFYQNEATQGIDPQYVNSALANQEGQQLTNINTVRNSLGGALNNPQGTIGDMNAQNNASTLSLLGNLGAQNQGIKNTAMGNELSTSNNAQQTALVNMLSGINAGNSGLSDITSYLGNGTSDLTAALGSYNGLTTMYGNSAAAAAKTAAADQQSGDNMFASALSMFG